MRVLSMLCSIVAALTMTMSAAAQTTDAARQEITTAEDAWRQARIDGDVGFLERLYAEESRMQGIDGKLQSREADIDIFRTGKIKPKFINHGPLDITVYGNTAVVTGVDHLGGTAFGRYGEMYIRFTDVLVYRRGRWQLIIQQGTLTAGP